eukprot:CAMPEP_0203752396 /NCGR_PEP_ID=MMETSP0098-20131031/6336_1 /ASSEMBLY_ACC=CAM_ASM_000208 /TAXON_ID=96639 /ORGANISM=" , Strain NY0313808BC1" /LENGTH=754 /DNA_ID=CAMNT_0050642547 /DNA_START=363 /DNA_END=2624 /DNA_ORIENTATION=+
MTEEWDGEAALPPGSPVHCVMKPGALGVDVSGLDDVEEMQAKMCAMEQQKVKVFRNIKRTFSGASGSLDGGSKAGSLPDRDNEEDMKKIFVSTIPVHDHNEKYRTTTFQRVHISDVDEDVSEETSKICKRILDASKLRDKYILQDPFAPYWGGIDQTKFAQVSKKLADKSKAHPGGMGNYRRRLDPPYIAFPESEEDDYFTCRKQKYGPGDYQTQFVDGVMEVRITSGVDGGSGERLSMPPTVHEFYKDLFSLVGTVHDAACKSICFKRLKLLESLFELHRLLNSEKENEVQKMVPHRDFYNVRKVDTHIHHSAIMNQKHLLRFIKSKLKRCPNEVVINRDDKFLTLSEVFRSLSLTAYDLSIDTLDMHADNTFHRFDRFNLKYNPVGESRLREVFLKTDNLIGGRYLADITKEVFDDLEANKYVMLEPRVSIYGRHPAEWTKLANWYYSNRLATPNVRWMIQIPRLYSIYKGIGLINTFQEMLDNIFAPLFEVTLDPSSDPQLDNFLNQITGFDCVDDESKMERYVYSDYPVPAKWDLKENPPYSYWIYYIYANLYNLNSLRKRLGMSTFSFRPHAGEAGEVNNLAATFLCADHINHGILLRKSPALQYLYYLKQIGLALSPLSNNKLFLDYHSNPFPAFFARGLNVSLSTDDPLMLHITKEPLVEEYSVASQVWRFSSTDMCEIARNSVMQSGFEYPYKAHFLGQGFDNQTQGPNFGNNITYTNVPDIRIMYRQEQLKKEWAFIHRGAEQHK